MKLYGLKVCDTCRKARQEIEKAGKSVEFIDVRDKSLTPALISGFFAEFGEDVINRRSTTWRGLHETERNAAPEALLAAHPTLMKRPVIVAETGTTLGWTAKTRALHLGNPDAVS